MFQRKDPLVGALLLYSRGRILSLEPCCWVPEAGSSRGALLLCSNSSDLHLESVDFYGPNSFAKKFYHQMVALWWGLWVIFLVVAVVMTMVVVMMATIISVVEEIGMVVNDGENGGYNYIEKQASWASPDDMEW